MQTDFEPLYHFQSTATQTEECLLQLRPGKLKHCAVLISDLGHERQS